MTRPEARDDLFGSPPDREVLAEGALLLRGFARDEVPVLVKLVESVAGEAPFRNMETPGGFRMSVAMTNCGPLGWVTDRGGYRYDPADPETGLPWPTMPDAFTDLARRAAEASGFSGFSPDSCLVNRYAPGARLSLHQDRNERDYARPIVSVSLGLPATFLFGRSKRTDRPRRIRLSSGDVVVWGGEARLAFHGVDMLADGVDPVTGRCRYNLTFRMAG